MSEAVLILAWVVAIASALPAAVFVIEVAASMCGRGVALNGGSSPASPPGGGSPAALGEGAGGGHPRPRVAVLLPAHDEEDGLAASLASFAPQLREGDRLLVVADNCSDATADVARRAGAEAVERRDPERRGKGYALDFGLRALADDPPAVVVVMDADCRAEPGAIDALAWAVSRYDRPAQGVYVLTPPAAQDRASAGKSAVSVLAFLVKNLVRPLGLSRLGLPCLLTGTGMAFSWDALRGVDLASGEIVEDMALGLTLARRGRPPRLCLSAVVKSSGASGDAAAAVQRRRWEHGHLATLLREAPRLAWAGVARGRPGLVGLAVELAVPPLSLLLILMIIAVGLGLVAGVTGQGGHGWGPMMLSGVAVGLVAVSVAAGWWRHGRSLVSGRSLLAAPAYVWWKIPIYLRFLGKRERAWIRTQRNRP